MMEQLQRQTAARGPLTEDTQQETSLETRASVRESSDRHPFGVLP